MEYEETLQTFFNRGLLYLPRKFYFYKKVPDLLVVSTQ